MPRRENEHEMKVMKKFRKFSIGFCAAILAALCLSSCSSLSNMSYEDAYDIGRGAGTLMRNLIDN